MVTGLQSKFVWKSVAASAIGGGMAQQLNSAMGYDLKTMPFNLGKSFVSGFGGALTSAVVRGGKVNGAQVAADAFGNVIGDKLAAANGQSSNSSTGQQEDRLGDFITQNQGAWDQRYANYQQVVSAFSQAAGGSVNRSSDRLLAGEMTGGMLFGKSGRVSADGPYINLPKTPIAPVLDAGTGPEITVSASVSRTQGAAQAAWLAAEAQATSDLYAHGAGNIREAVTPIASQRAASAFGMT